MISSLPIIVGFELVLTQLKLPSMSIRYLLPCPECDQSNELETKQAGQDLNCVHCDANISAPKLGILKQLPQLEGDTKEKAKKKGQGSGNVLATLGLGVLLLAGLAGGGLYYYGGMLQKDMDVYGNMEVHLSLLDELTPSQLVEHYQRIDPERGLGEWRELPVSRYNRQGAILKNFSYGLFGIAGIGLVIFLVSLFSGKKKTS